MYLLNN